MVKLNKILMSGSIFSAIFAAGLTFYSCQNSPELVNPSSAKACESAPPEYTPPEGSLYLDSLTFSGNVNDEEGWVKIQAKMKIDGDVLPNEYFIEMAIESDSVSFVASDLALTLLNEYDEKVVDSVSTVGFYLTPGGHNEEAIFEAQIQLPSGHHFDTIPDNSGNFKIKVIKPGESCYPGGSKCPSRYWVRSPLITFPRPVGFCVCFLPGWTS